YGHFDMERILRVMRPIEDQVVIKATGMHAVEDYIMSRYQMYWQVYFHPVTRSAEVILSRILHRAKYLYESPDYVFKLKPTHFVSFFEEKVELADYLKLDENIVQYYFQLWQEETDDILRDLCERFMNRYLFKYVEFNQFLYKKSEELKQLFAKAGIDPEYYLIVDSSSDLPYDFYRPGEAEERLPIHLLMLDDSLKELSRHSDIVESISGKKRTDHKLYFPLDLLDTSSDHDAVAEIKEIVNVRGDVVEDVD